VSKLISNHRETSWFCSLQCASGALLGDALWSKALRFAIVGGLSGCIFAGATFTFVTLAGFEDKLSSALAYIVSMPLNFIGHRIFSFRSTTKILPSAGRFAVIHLVNILITILAMGAAVDVLKLPYYLGVFAAIVVVPLANFFLMDAWVFSNHGVGPKHSRG
jgi:putative flippase GtrA